MTEPDDTIAEHRRLPTVTLEGWRQFVDNKPATLTLLDRGDYDATEQEFCDERRIAYHSELVIVETSTVREIVNHGRLLMMLNQREISARRSLIVDGPWASGKSTTIKLLGKVHEQKFRRRWPEPGPHPRRLHHHTTEGFPRKLASESAHFLGIPDKQRYNATDIADAVCHVLTEARTDLAQRSHS